MNGIRYPGDFGGEPEDVREEKAQAYAARVRADADLAAHEALLKDRQSRTWRNLWGWL